MQLSFIGGGTMAEAMITGIVSQNLAAPESISVSEPIEERCHFLRDKYGVFTTTNNIKAVERGTLVILAVKPQILPAVMTELKGSLTENQTVLSIVAGTRLIDLIQGLGHNSVIRVMPNTPAQIGQGISVWTCSNQVNTDNQEITRSILDSLGEQIYVRDEKFLDMATALSASGPAYVFLFIEALIDSGVHLGMPRELAHKLTLQTILGSTKLVQQRKRHLAELRNDVTSPGGTTAEGLLALEEGGFRATIMNAVIAAYERSLELGG